MRSLLLSFLLIFCFAGYGQVIFFPDANFKNALVNTNCVDLDGDGIGDADADLNDDGEIDISEALEVKNLDVSYSNIYSLEGIEHFRSLTELNCSSSELISLDIQALTNLTDLDCSWNRIISLHVQGLTNLTNLNCSWNRLPSLNVQGLSNLTTINCLKNKLISLDLKELTNLLELNCGYNQLTSLEIKDLTNLKHLFCDNNQLSFLDLKELRNLENIDCHNNHITSLELNNLGKLRYLDCGANSLTSININMLQNLVHLNCADANLTSIDVNGMINLEFLSCVNNQLTLIDVQDLKNLKYLYLGNNQLTSLNVQGLTRLGFLGCGDNLLVNLNVKGLMNLEYLYCTNNQLKSLNLFDLNNLTELYCGRNQLESLNVAQLLNLTDLSCSNNQLSTLNIKGTKLDGSLFFQGNPILSHICCEDDRIDSVKNISILNGQNCEVNSYCSFTPGGKYYVLKGKNMIDFNNNGCEGQGINLQSTKFNITNTIGNITGSFISNSTGRYSIPLQEGTHTITPILEHPDYFEISPSSITVTFPHTSDTITQDFCITPKGIFRQTNITVIPLTPPARPGFEAQYKIVWENVGNQIESGTLNFTYDETLLDYISATQTADLIADGIIKWNFTNLLPFEKREIIVTLKVNRPTDTPSVNAGDKLYLTASILDNIFTLENTVVGSYDPNDKTCLQGDRVKPDMVGEYVDYLIRFENTGNYAAENVVVKDIIDTKTFDVSTLKITDASHEVYTRIEGNKVEFIFENIQLPFDDVNNDGYIAFKIKTLPSLVLGDSLKNLADIYFDYNFPIRTNEAQTTIALPVFTKDITTEVSIYPNPVNDILFLDTNETWTKAEIYDIAGRIMRSFSLDGQSIDVSGLESGTYFIRLKDGAKVGLVKFVKI